MIVSKCSFLSNFRLLFFRHVENWKRKATHPPDRPSLRTVKDLRAVVVMLPFSANNRWSIIDKNQLSIRQIPYPLPPLSTTCPFASVWKPSRPPSSSGRWNTFIEYFNQTFVVLVLKTTARNNFFLLNKNIVFVNRHTEIVRNFQLKWLPWNIFVIRICNINLNADEIGQPVEQDLATLKNNFWYSKAAKKYSIRNEKYNGKHKKTDIFL